MVKINILISDYVSIITKAVITMIPIFWGENSDRKIVFSSEQWDYMNKWYIWHTEINLVLKGHDITFKLM